MDTDNIDMRKSAIARIKRGILTALHLLGIVIVASAAIFILWLALWVGYDLGFVM